MELTPEEILELIQVGTALAKIINKSVIASNNEELMAAWKSAQGSFNEGFDEAYEKSN